MDDSKDVPSRDNSTTDASEGADDVINDQEQERSSEYDAHIKVIYYINYIKI